MMQRIMKELIQELSKFVGADSAVASVSVLSKSTDVDFVVDPKSVVTPRGISWTHNLHLRWPSMANVQTKTRKTMGLGGAELLQFLRTCFFSRTLIWFKESKSTRCTSSKCK